MSIRSLSGLVFLERVSVDRLCGEGEVGVVGTEDTLRPGGYVVRPFHASASCEEFTYLFLEWSMNSTPVVLEKTAPSLRQKIWSLVMEVG